MGGRGHSANAQKPTGGLDQSWPAAGELRLAGRELWGPAGTQKQKETKQIKILRWRGINNSCLEILGLASPIALIQLVNYGCKCIS